MLSIVPVRNSSYFSLDCYRTVALKADSGFFFKVCQNNKSTSYKVTFKLFWWIQGYYKAVLLPEKSSQDTLSLQCCNSYIHCFQSARYLSEQKNMQLGQKLIDKTKGCHRREVTQRNTCWCE